MTPLQKRSTRTWIALRSKAISLYKRTRLPEHEWKYLIQDKFSSLHILLESIILKAMKPLASEEIKVYKEESGEAPEEEENKKEEMGKVIYRCYVLGLGRLQRYRKASSKTGYAEYWFGENTLPRLKRMASGTRTDNFSKTTWRKLDYFAYVADWYGILHEEWQPHSARHTSPGEEKRIDDIRDESNLSEGLLDEGHDSPYE